MMASLPMYDWPEVRGAQEAFWSHLRGELRARGVDAPDALSAEAGWREPGLVFSQTCGWPWATNYSEALDLVAVPVHPVPGCGAGTYASMVVVREESRFATLGDLRGGVVAYNGLDSQSGVHTLREAAGPLAGERPFFGQGVESGAHRDSLRMVADGRADCAAVDAVCWAMAQDFERDAVARLRIVHVTAPAPALPFVTRAGGPVDAVCEALEETVAAGLGEAMLVGGLVTPDAGAYRGLVERVAGVPGLFA